MGVQGGDLEPDLDKVADVLRRVDAWSVSYDDWVRVLMALHHDFGDAGLRVAEQWAKGAPGEVERKFRSFKAGGNPTGVVTSGTIFEIAKRFH